MAGNAVEATDVALVILSVFAPAILLLIVALLRGYNVRLWVWRDKKNHDNESQED